MKNLNKEHALSFEYENELNVVEALDKVQELVKDSKLSSEFWEECAPYLDYLSSKLELNKNQVILLAIMSEVGESMSWRKLGEFMGLSRLKTMAFTPDLSGLRKKRWIYRSAARERMGMYDGFKLVRGVIKALRHNEKFIPEKIEGLSEQVFVDRLTRYVANEGNNNNIPYEEHFEFIMELVEANSHLPINRAVKRLVTDTSKMILLLEVADYARYCDTENEGLCIGEIQNWIGGEPEFDSIAEELQNGEHELFLSGILEHGFDEGMIDRERYKFTEEAKSDLLSEFHPHKQGRRNIPIGKDIIESKEIKKKTLYYKEEELSKIKRIESLLNKDGFANVQQRLEESGLRKGIACLFYGAPGTGKTESVLQLARETGRDIMRVDISGLRDKFVGESEKNIKAIFNRYRYVCSQNKPAPILFFNEADAIFNNRFETTNSSVEKMDNAMQNIILQEMEDLEGILIATTNLTGVLDKAFDRRFLFKIEFSKPDIEVKKAIWKSLMPEIKESDIIKLATEFDFTGGQIENIVRKCKIEYVISGIFPSLEQIREFSKEEYLNRATHNKVGF
ncbi:MAG: AAA family ATPase [Muribaculaceae bacterium]|nr:AAA family ATPase [Muribaculaceae bacterium]